MIGDKGLFFNGLSRLISMFFPSLHRGIGVRSFDDYLADLHAALSLVRARHRALPCFLVGHSMGGLITIRAVLAKPGEVAGAVVSSPLLAPHPSAVPSRATRMAAGLLSKVAPGLLIPSGLDSSALSHDQAVVDAAFRLQRKAKPTAQS